MRLALFCVVWFGVMWTEERCYAARAEGRYDGPCAPPQITCGAQGAGICTVGCLRTAIAAIHIQSLQQKILSRRF